jgi:hypothetical protein
MNIVYCFCGTTFDLTTHPRCPHCHEEVPGVTERLISDYLTGAMSAGLIKGAHTRSVRTSVGGFGGKMLDYYAVEPVCGEPVEYDRNGILAYVEMLKEAGVEPRSVF